MSTINLIAHGFVGGERIVLTDLVGGAPLDADFVYFVLAAGITADTFQISETDGGTALTFDTLTSANMQVVSDVYEGSNVTASATTDLITSVAHGFVVDDAIQFTILVGGDGLAVDTLYYIIASGFTADTFKVSLTLGGAAVDILTDVTAGFVTRVAGYTPITDPEDVQAPPQDRHVTHTWPDAPGQPQNFIMSGGFKGFGVAWDSTTVNDLQFNEVRYAPDDGTGTGVGDTPTWIIVRSRANAIWVANLPIGVLYWAQVRAVDTSDNVVTSDIDPTPVNFLANLDAGYTTLMSTTTLAVGKEDVAFNSVITNILNANQIDASTILTGILKVNTSDTSMADGIEIWNTGIRVGLWDETGLYIGTQASGLPGDLSGSDYIQLNDAGLFVYKTGVVQTAVTPDGINASAINFGLLPGGHNLIQNSSFELSDFAPAPTTKVWDVQADWTGTEVSSANRTNNAGNVTATGTSF